jgi:ribosomal protein L37E
MLKLEFGMQAHESVGQCMSCSESVQNDRYKSTLMDCHASGGSSFDTVADSCAHCSAGLAPSRAVRHEKMTSSATHGQSL